MPLDKFSHLRGKILSSKIYPEFFQFKTTDRVINIGCGQGPQAVAYRDQFKEMIGVDINQERLDISRDAMKLYNVKNYRTICANVEKIPLPDNTFDKALAIDIIEHVENPRQLCHEANRLLKQDGELLIGFPAMHDKFLDFVSKIGRFILRKPKAYHNPNIWNPDHHNQAFTIPEWIKLIEGVGFKLLRSRATTLFPPIHLYGIPRFWLKNNLIHSIDSYLCQKDWLKNYGQTVIGIFKKI